MSKKLKKHSVDGYRDFLKSLNVSFIALSDCDAHVDRGRYFETKEELMFAAQAKATNITAEAFDVEAEISVKAQEAGKKDGSLRIGVTYLLHFHSKEPLQKSYVQRFVNSDVRLMVWPYFREFIAATTGRMHIPPVTLPITDRDEQS